jgi:hypothetical protein
MASEGPAGLTPATQSSVGDGVSASVGGDITVPCGGEGELSADNLIQAQLSDCTNLIECSKLFASEVQSFVLYVYAHIACTSSRAVMR